MSEITDENRERLLALGQIVALDAEAAKIAGVLRNRSVPSLVLRGPSVARRLYVEAELRNYVDVDLLVPAPQFAEAEAALCAAGYTESPIEAFFGARRPGHAHSWASPSGLDVDLHQTLIGIGTPPDDVWPAFSEDAEEMTIGRERVQVASPPALALIVGLHAGHHLGRVEHTARDLELALIHLPRTVWEEAVVLARRLEATGMFVAGLRSQHSGRSLLRELGIETADRPHRELAGDRAFHMANDLASLRATRGTRAKAAFLIERLLPDARTLETSTRLARLGRPGLWVAYGIRVLSALPRLPRALAGLRASARENG